MKGNLDQHIDAQLKTSFDAIQKKVPMHLWKQISEKMDADDRMDAALDEKIQRVHLDNLFKKAPAPVWDKIETALEEVPPIDAIIDEKIKAVFLLDSKVAPVFLWGAISEELSTLPVSLDKALDHKLKAGFLTQKTKKTPNKVWYALSRQLNIDKTWSRISESLDKDPIVSDWSGRMLQFCAVAALFLLLLKTCTHKPYTLPNSDFVQRVNASKKVNISTVSSIDHLAEARLSKGENSKLNTTISKLLEGTKNSKKLKEGLTNTMLQNENKASEKGRKAIILPFVPDRSTENSKEEPLVIAAVPTKEEALEESKEGSIRPRLGTDVNSKRIKNTQGVGKQELNITLLDALALNPLTLKNTTERIQLLDEMTLEKKVQTSKKLIEGKLEAGVFVVVNSTMLLNNETKEGFDQNSLTTNYFGLAANYGFWASYRIFPKGALVAEFSINADNRQAYGMYEKGVFYVKEWLMKYNRFSLGYKQELWQTSSDKFVQTKIVAQAGVYMGILREAKVFYDGVLFFDKQSDYHQFDFGFKVALGQEILIDKFVFGYGFRSDIGAANIFKGNKQLKSKEDQTTIIHLGGYVLLGYRF